MAELEVVEFNILGDNLAQISVDLTTTTVSLLDNVILLSYYDQLTTTSYTQLFGCIIDDILDKKKMLALFPTRNVIRSAALEHTKGRTNKVAFSANLKKLLESDKINQESYDLLSNLIKDSTCPPVKLFERLTRMGYGHIIVALDFYEEDPLLTSSILEFEKFISLLPEEV